MALAPTTVDAPPPFGPAVVGRGLDIQWTVHERSATTGEWTPRDISGARWTYRLHVWAADDDTSMLVDAAITKGAAATSGELDHYHSCGATVYTAALLWEIVQVDNNKADTSTKSNQAERVLLRWRQPILDAPVA